ncbi:MAG: SAVED domain-containing protein [Plesiomonas shigelloides]
MNKHIKFTWYKFLSWGDAFVRWYTRPKSKLMITGHFLVTTGVIGLLGVVAFKVTYAASDGSQLTLSVQENDLPLYITAILLMITALGLILIVVDVLRFMKDSKEVNNILIEHIALFSPLSTSFASTVSKAHGRVNSYKIDISQYYKGGVLTNPRDAINTTHVMLESSLAAQTSSTGNSKAVVHYGGTPPVSFGFYAGYCVGNTTKVELWDYERDGGLWHPLNRGFDDNIPVICIDEYQEGSKEVALLMSISFDVDIAARACSPTKSLVTITMPEILHDNMSSLSKLNYFLNEFRQLLNRLSRDGVERVHVYCAAQASFNFAVGQQITKNHPAFLVYEYVHSSEEKYPWGLEFNGRFEERYIIRKHS